MFRVGWSELVRERNFKKHSGRNTWSGFVCSRFWALDWGKNPLRIYNSIWGLWNWCLEKTLDNWKWVFTLGFSSVVLVNDSTLPQSNKSLQQIFLWNKSWICLINMTKVLKSSSFIDMKHFTVVLSCSINFKLSSTI